MKAYTSIEQAKKLAEILPIESADMHYIILGTHEEPKHIVGLGEYIGILPSIPCWSLAALFDVLPEINGVNLKFERVKAEDGYNGYYYHIEYEDKVLIPYCKNPTDACYEMIIKLYELNLL